MCQRTKNCLCLLGLIIPFQRKYSQSEAGKAVAYSALCNGQYETLYFPVITCGQVTLLGFDTFNSCEHFRTFSIISANFTSKNCFKPFPEFSKNFRRFPKIFRKFSKLVNLKPVCKIFGHLRRLRSSSENLCKFYEDLGMDKVVKSSYAYIKYKLRVAYSTVSNLKALNK